ncbi:hypothetical protein ABZ461_36400 [Actinacidiphila glaucinigra]|uniref:hypothetical protein n=1 Tax=Actinacidiphila glaucinigra TaxID=235986 RepID=UPI0033E4E53B
MTEYVNTAAWRPQSTPQALLARRGSVLCLGIAGAAASTLPVVGISQWLNDSIEPFHQVLGIAVLVVGMLVALPVMLPMAKHVRMSRPGYAKLVLALVLTADTAAMLLLTRILPFRIGLLSCLLYVLPAALVACTVVLRSRRVAMATLGGFVAVFALAAPVRTWQQQVAAQEWFRTTGVPSRAMVQIVGFPGMAQEAYTWDGKQLTAMFDYPMGPQTIWMAAETVAQGNVDPCGPLLTADGDTSSTESPPCTQERPGLWYRGTTDKADGYVLQRDGVTICVTGGVWPNTSKSQAAYTAERKAALRHVILAAHPATDAELWPRIHPASSTPLGFLLL